MYKWLYLKSYMSSFLKLSAHHILIIVLHHAPTIPFTTPSTRTLYPYPIPMPIYDHCLYMTPTHDPNDDPCQKKRIWKEGRGKHF